MKKKFLLIAGYLYYPSRSTGDWKGFFETREEALEEAKSYSKIYDWCDVVDIEEWDEWNKA